jgi:hypothetical protein
MGNEPQEGSAPIDELVGFLSVYAPEELSEIRNKYPAAASILSPGILAGKAPIKENLDPARTEVASVALREVIQHGRSAAATLRRKIQFGRHLQFISQLCSVLGSSALLAMIKWQMHQSTQLPTAMLVTVASILALWSKQVTDSPFSKKSRIEIYERLVTLLVTASGLRTNIEGHLRSADFSGSTSDIKRANSVAAEIRRILLLS